MNRQRRCEIMPKNTTFPRSFFFLALCTLLLFCAPVLGDGALISRTVSPSVPTPGGVVNVTLSLPAAFFGGIVEDLPKGFEFLGTSHPDSGVKQSGSTVIFAVTGEEEIIYSVRVPLAGCGTIAGKWEDIKNGIAGTIPETIIAPEGTAPASCAGAPQKSPGFGIPASICAFLFAALIAGTCWCGR